MLFKSLPAALGLVVLGAAALGSCNGQQAAQVSPAQFQELRWLDGTWRGSGGAYPAFFEEYRFIDDSTIRMRAFSDSTLGVVSDSSLIVRRGGVVESRGGGSVSVATQVTPTSVRFVPRGAARGGYTYTRVSADEWTATLHPAAPDARPTVYGMRRIRP